MKKYVVGLGVLTIFSLGLISFNYLHSLNPHESAEPPPPKSYTPFQELKSQDCTVLPPKKYELKEYEGNLAIFKSGMPSPIRITSTSIEGLPIKDQELLRSGIEASSEEELNMLLEDYCS